MEVTQFTYFQQAGGRTLDAPAVEITYGLERILMGLQGVKHFKDIRSVAARCQGGGGSGGLARRGLGEGRCFWLLGAFCFLFCFVLTAFVRRASALHRTVPYVRTCAGTTTR